MRGVGTARRGTMAGRGVVASSFDPFTPISWYVAAWAGDPSWTNPGDGVGVSSWRDGSGNSRTLTQATSGKQPIFRASVAALNGKPAVQFDGVDDFLATAAYSTVSNPWSFVTVAKMNTIVDNKYILGTGGSAGLLVSTVSTNHFRLYAGSSLVSTLAADTTAHFLHGVVNIASSKIGRDGTQQTGNAGGNSQTNLYAGSFDSGQAFAACHIAFAAVYNGDVTGHANWASFKASVATEYAMTIA